MEKHNTKLETAELTPQDFDAAATLLAEAFSDNPSHQYIFVDPSTRLMTQKEINVRFYQKLGFKIVHKSTIGTGQNAFINWCLIFDDL